MNFKSRSLRMAILFCGAIAFFGLSVHFASRRIASTESHNQLAQIIAIETDLLKKWQESGALHQTLAYDAAGSSVVLLQRMLAQDPGIYPEQKITGYYGDNTRDAVTNFQREYGLPQTGAVDAATLEKLNSIFLLTLCPEPEVVYPDFLMRKVSKDAKLPTDYVPPQLIDVSKKLRTMGVACLRADVVSHIAKMFSDASNDGVNLMITSGYRKPEIQKYLYDLWTRLYGSEASSEIAEPGASEHQLGSAVDLTDGSIQFSTVDTRFETSKGGKWMAENAYKYGFILSFPKDKTQVTGYVFEPWHWRYVGESVAASLKYQGLTYNEAHFDTLGMPSFAAPQAQAGISLSAAAFISVYVDTAGVEHILVENNKDRKLPIASMTKLTVALVASERYAPKDTVAISTKAIKNKGPSQIYTAGQHFYFEDALKALLLASHNEIANSLADGSAGFVDALNSKAVALGLSNTHFVNPTGLDPQTGSESINESTVYDMYALARYIKEKRPQILSITTLNGFELKTEEGKSVATLTSTDKLLGDASLPFRILGGKNGETPRAKQNLVLVTESPCGGEIISAVIGSDNSFGDMKELLNYDKQSYNWSCSR